MKENIAKAWGLLTLLSFGTAIVSSIFSGVLGILGMYSIPLLAISFWAYGFVAWAIIKQLGNEKINKPQQSAIVLAGLFGLMILLPQIYGTFQDAQGVHCQGIMGAESTCLRSWTLASFFLFYDGVTGPLILILIGVLAGYGLITHVGRAKQPKKL